MAESSAEMFARVRLMARLDTDWDLSDKDTAALRHVLAAAEAREATPPPSLKRGKPRECTCLGFDPCTCAGPPAAEAIEAAEKALDETESGAWDSHYGKGLSVSYARSVGAARKEAKALIARWKEAHGEK